MSKKQKVEVTICTDGKLCSSTCSYLDNEYTVETDRNTGQVMANCTLFRDEVFAERDGREYDLYFERCFACEEATKKKKRVAKRAVKQ